MVSSRRSRMVMTGLGLVAAALVVIYLVVNRPPTPESFDPESVELENAVTATGAALSPLTTPAVGDSGELRTASPLTSVSTGDSITTSDSVTSGASVSTGSRGNTQTEEGAADDNRAHSSSEVTKTATCGCVATGTPAVTSTSTITPTPTSTPTPQPSPTRAPPVFDEAVEVPIYDYTVVTVYPHDPEAFTQGLQYVEGMLYEGTGLRGDSSLRQVALETGEVLRRIELPEEYFGEGITVVEDRIFQLTWQSYEGFIYDRATFDQVGSFQYTTEGWGLTYDGEHLIMSDGTANLYRRDPATFEEVEQVTVTTGGTTVPLLNELEYIEGEIYANVWQTDWIARIDPATGKLLGWIDLTGLLDQATVTGRVDVLNGIAYDDEEDRLFVTGKWWPALFEIELVPR